MDFLQSPEHWVLKDKQKKAKNPRGSHQIPACLVHGAFSEQNFKQKAAASRLLIPRALPDHCEVARASRVGGYQPQQLPSCSHSAEDQSSAGSHQGSEKWLVLLDTLRVKAQAPAGFQWMRTNVVAGFHVLSIPAGAGSTPARW